MPARKNNKNRTEVELSPRGENVNPSIAAVELGYEAREAPSPFPGDPPAWKKLATELSQSDKAEADEELILTYLACYRLLEQALVRGGFVMALSRSKQARPDWYRWARHIEKQFDPLSSEELGMSVAHLLDRRDDMQARPVRTQNRLQWQTGSPYSDNLWLADMLQQTRMQLTHRYNFPDTPGCDTPQVMSALLIVEAWLPLVPGG